MAGFIKDYLNNLRHSDEKTKHRSALTISVVTSVIILSILFLIFKDVLFFKKNPLESVQSQESEAAINENKPESPLASFSNFLRESGRQFSGLKNIFTDIPEIFKKEEEQNIDNLEPEKTIEIKDNIRTENIYLE